MEKSSKSSKCNTKESPITVYQRAIKLVAQDNLHDAIAKKGLDLLRQKIPYVVVAARWQKYEKLKRKSSHEIPMGSMDSIIHTNSIWDPFEQLLRNDTLRIIAEALSELPDEDIIAVWGKFEGRSDKEILKIWVEKNLGPPEPQLSLIRQRRARAIKKIRATLKKKLK